MADNMAALDKARQKQKEMREQGIKIVQLDPIERAKKHPTSLKKAIAAMCFDCQGRNADPKVRERIGNCASEDCPLYTHRPYQKYKQEA